MSMTSAAALYNTGCVGTRLQAMPVFESDDVRLYSVKARAPPHTSLLLPLQAYMHFAVSFSFSESALR